METRTTSTRQQINIGKNSPVTYDAVMTYLHSINMTIETKHSVGKSLVNEAKREDAQTKLQEQFRIKKDLDLFATYKENWDGEGGLPVSTEALKNVESLLPYLSSRCLLQIDIYPENNGSLLIMWRTKEAGINIGNDTYTFYQINDNEVDGKSHLPFNIDDVIETAEKIAA